MPDGNAPMLSLPQTAQAAGIPLYTFRHAWRDMCETEGFPRPIFAKTNPDGKRGPRPRWLPEAVHAWRRRRAETEPARPTRSAYAAESDRAMARLQALR